MIMLTEEILLASLAGTPEGFDAQCRSLHMFVGGDTFVFSSVEEVLALVRDKRPLCKGTTSVSTGCRSFACWPDASRGLVVDALLLQQNLCRNRQSWWLKSHVLVCTEALVDPFQGEAEAVRAMCRRW